MPTNTPEVDFQFTDAKGRTCLPFDGIEVPLPNPAFEVREQCHLCSGRGRTGMFNNDVCWKCGGEGSKRINSFYQSETTNVLPHTQRLKPNE